MTYIMKDNKKICSTKASDITYDNTNSGLTSETLNDAIDESHSLINNTWLSDCDVYEEIEKMVEKYGATSTFMLSFGTNVTNSPDDWIWWCLLYKCARIIAYKSNIIATNGRNGANTFTGWTFTSSSSDIPFKFGVDGDGNYGYYGADGSLVPFKKSYPSNYIYAYGDMCYNTTGGWRHACHGTYYSVTFSSDHIYLYSACSTFPVQTISENKIDFTNYSKIVIKAKIITDDSSKRSFLVYLCSGTSHDSDGINQSYAYSHTTYYASETDVTIEYDISSISGSYYLQVYAVLCDVRIYEIYLE